jgi:hypothetical protein
MRRAGSGSPALAGDVKDGNVRLACEIKAERLACRP